MHIDAQKIETILSFIRIKGSNEEIIKSLKNNGINDETYLEGVNELEEVIKLISSFGLDKDAYTIDLTIARGLDYYTGTVYETNLKEYPKLGSICSGGRYENLTGYYTDQKLPGIGISIGLTRLFSQLKEEGIISTTKKSLIDTLIVPLDEENMDYVLEVANRLRDKGLKADVYYGTKGMKQKMKYADKLGVPYVIVIGSDEVSNKVVTLKNMVTGEQEVVQIDSLTSKFC